MVCPSMCSFGEARNATWYVVKKVEMHGICLHFTRSFSFCMKNDL